MSVSGTTRLNIRVSLTIAFHNILSGTAQQINTVTSVDNQCYS